VLLMLLARLFPSAGLTSIHEAFVFSVVGMAIYSSQLARFIWLDFKTSKTVTAGYVSLVVLSGSVWWWFYTVIVWALFSSWHTDIQMSLNSLWRQCSRTSTGFSLRVNLLNSTTEVEP
jgi:hypothetical protein